MTRLLPVLAAVFAVACADYDLASKEADLDSAAGSDSLDSGTDGPDDTGAPEIPAWYTVRASLAVADGAASRDGASVDLDIIDADLVRTDCAVTLDATLIASGDLETDAVQASWELPVHADSAPCATLPDTLLLGIGTLPPDVRARLGAVGRDGVADSLYGAYVRADADEVFAFGYAGTPGDLAGETVATAPLPDGIYTLAPLYLLALPE